MSASIPGHFKKHPVVIKSPIKLRINEVTIDDEHIDYTGEQVDYGFGCVYELCEIKVGTKLWAQVMSSGAVHLSQGKNDMDCVKSDAISGVDFDWEDPVNNPQAQIDALKKQQPGAPQP